MLQPVTPPAIEPLSLADAKLQLRVEHSSEDGLIQRLIASARRMAEAELRRPLVSQVWQQVLDRFPADRTLDLEFPVVSTVASVTYTDPAGITQILPSSVYVLDSIGLNRPGRLVLKPGQTWPATQDESVSTVRVEFTAGWPNAESVPDDLKTWLLLQVGHLYKNREASTDRAAEMLPGLEIYLSPYRVTRFV